MYARRRFYRRRPRKYIRRVKKARVSKATKRYVKKAIHRTIENKEFISYGANQTIVTASATTPTGINLLQLPGQGIGGSARLGNSIKVVSGVIRGKVSLMPYNATNNPLSCPILVRIMMVRCLSTNTQTLASVPWTEIFKINNSATGFQNSPLDMGLLPVNDMLFRVLGNKVIKLGASTASSTGPVGTGGYYDNSPMIHDFYFNYGKYCKKNLKIDESAGLSNDNCWLVFQAVNADGTSTAVNVAKFHYANRLAYEDA